MDASVDHLPKWHGNDNVYCSAKGHSGGKQLQKTEFQINLIKSVENECSDKAWWVFRI
jgi:hypothetical protein